MFDGAATFIALLDEPNSSAMILNDTSAPGSPGSGTSSAAHETLAMVTEAATAAAIIAPLRIFMYFLSCCHCCPIRTNSWNPYGHLSRTKMPGAVSSAP